MTASDRTPLTSFSQLLDAIVATVRASDLLPTNADVRPAEGPLTEAWLQRNSMPQGGALSALAAVPTFERNAAGVFQPTLQLGLYFIPAPGRRGDQAKALADQVWDCLRLIDNQRWGLSGLKRPASIDATNRFSQSLASQGSSLWIVNWRQTVRIETDGSLTGRDLTPNLPAPADASEVSEAGDGA